VVEVHCTQLVEDSRGSGSLFAEAVSLAAEYRILSAGIAETHFVAAQNRPESQFVEEENLSSVRITVASSKAEAVAAV
jgi:hypothetical protein